ncbi:DnaD domain protein [Clostridiaceae bacterium NSJ-31]|uniref:DnaD domain protein n=2 Tax=Ligaoa zhengdingensis TaxID=2763658 RepID=A0A926DWD0_9FIRM|nr:DnaD domain protein [Ligaoa zhengdingensis]MBC8545956.1 DnaD domain protein [Ligaoa zhengdingensis]
MKYSLNFGIWNSVFAVPTQIVDKHLKLCGVAHLKVLLLLLRRAGEAVELADLAAALNLSAGDTQDALNYWIGAGVLCALPDEDSVRLTVPSTNAEPAPAFPVASQTPAPRPSGSPPKLRLTSAEIAKLARSSAEFQALLTETEAALGKTLTSSDLATLASLYDWAGIPADVLLTVIEYCRQIGKTNLRYIEKVAMAWQERGIDTLEKAEHYIRESLEADKRQQLCKAAFGIYDRALTSKECEYIRTWFCDYGFDLPVIKLAYERSIENTGKLSFPYINKVLSNWRSQNIRTPEQVAKESSAFARQKAEQQKPKSSYDIDELEAYLAGSTPK